jgi:glycine cleavage system H protein
MSNKNYEFPSDLLYNRQNYWLKKTEGRVRVGLSDYGQNTVGDVLYLELGKEGQKLQQGEEFGSIEAGKWVGTLQAPIRGRIAAVHDELSGKPAAINNSPYQSGWLYEMDNVDESQLKGMMDVNEYRAWVQEQIKLEEQECQYNG